MAESLIRTAALVVGAPRHGKTFFSEQAAIRYARAGGTALAYNVGMDTDFKNFISVSLITPEVKLSQMRKTSRKVKIDDIPNSIDFFRVNETNKFYKMQDFNKVFKGKCVKIERLDSNKREERLLFDCIFEYMYNTMVIFDDFRAVTRHGMGSEFIQLFSRQNHAGKSYAPPGLVGVDLICIYHSFARVPEEMFDYTNAAVQFYSNQEPKVKTNDELSEILQYNYEYLKTAPKYTRFEINTKSLESRLILPQ